MDILQPKVRLVLMLHLNGPLHLNLKAHKQDLDQVAISIHVLLPADMITNGQKQDQHLPWVTNVLQQELVLLMLLKVNDQKLLRLNRLILPRLKDNNLVQPCPLLLAVLTFHNQEMDTTGISPTSHDQHPQLRHRSSSLPKLHQLAIILADYHSTLQVNIPSVIRL